MVGLNAHGFCLSGHAQVESRIIDANKNVGPKICDFLVAFAKELSNGSRIF